MKIETYNNSAIDDEIKLKHFVSLSYVAYRSSYFIIFNFNIVIVM